VLDLVSVAVEALVPQRGPGERSPVMGRRPPVDPTGDGLQILRQVVAEHDAADHRRQAQQLVHGRTSAVFEQILARWHRRGDVGEEPQQLVVLRPDLGVVLPQIVRRGELIEPTAWLTVHSGDPTPLVRIGISPVTPLPGATSPGGVQRRSTSRRGPDGASAMPVVLRIR